MDALQLCTGALVLLLMADSLLGDRETFVQSPESTTMPPLYQTTLVCAMNLAPDKFEWKFYPLGARDADNPAALLDLAAANYTVLSHHNYTSQKMRSSLNVVSSVETAGDYQCLAYYGALVVASVPGRITIATMGDAPPPPARRLSVRLAAGNTLLWSCRPPPSNPPATIDYTLNGAILPLPPDLLRLQSKAVLVEAVGPQHAGRYGCVAYSDVLNAKRNLDTMDLQVVDGATAAGEPFDPPHFLQQPRDEYVVNRGDSVLLECAPVGHPVPRVRWYRKSGAPLPPNALPISGGLNVTNATQADDGVYVCEYSGHQHLGTQDVRLVYNEPPSVDCPQNVSSVKLKESLFLNCTVRGVPAPQVSWLLNGFSVLGDSAVRVEHDRIAFAGAEKRHAGNLQVFASNRVGTVYGRISITVIPITTNISAPLPEERPRRRHGGRKPSGGGGGGKGSRKSTKHGKRVMIPPGKPVISRKDDETVVVRWNATNNKDGMAISFFKVQYRELGPAAAAGEHLKSKWNTCNEDIKAHARSFEVNGLKPEHYYKFRIAAVYENNDSLMSNNSEKFLLRRLDFENRNPLPVPRITSTESVDAASVKIYWEYIPNNITISGFYVYYLAADSAGDFAPVTVDGQDVRSFVLGHLAPDRYYDIKMQSFTPGYTSHYSPIMKARTKGKTSTTQPPPVVGSASPNTNTGGISQLYIIIAVAVVVGGLLISAIALLFICRKWKAKKNAGDTNKSAVDEHHIQTEGNEYIVGPKNMARANGCAISGNRMTITANPLAETDNKNNNCSVPAQPSVSGQAERPGRSRAKARDRERDREGAKRANTAPDSTSPLCVYKRD